MAKVDQDRCGRQGVVKVTTQEMLLIRDLLLKGRSRHDSTSRRLSAAQKFIYALRKIPPP